jgi:hypothetical protein
LIKLSRYVKKAISENKKKNNVSVCNNGFY